MAVVPDSLPNDLKVTALSPAAFRLWVLARCLCSANGTDGVIPASALRAPLAARRKDVAELVQAGLWHQLQSGAFVDHDYLVDNPASADAEAHRQSVAERVRRHRAKRNALRNALQPPLQGALQTPLPEALQETCALSLDPSGSGSGISSGFPERSSSYQPSSKTDQVARACPKAAPKPGRKSKAAAWREAQLALVPDETHRRIASERRVDLELELAKFRDHDFARPRGDAAATFRNWLRGARPSLNGSGSQSRAGDHAESLFAEAAALRAAENSR